MSDNPFGVCLEPKCDDDKTTTEQSLPSVGIMINNLAGSMKDIFGGVLHGEGVTVTEEVYNTRMNICRGCEFFIQDTKRCSQCGCFMEAKTRFKKTYCPVHKWEAE